MGLRDWVEEKVDRTRTKLQAKSSGRREDYASKAEMSRGVREVENLKRYNRGEISEDLYKKRQERNERQFERDRMTPEERATQVTERVITGSAKAVAAFTSDLEMSARGSAEKKPKRKSKPRASSGGGGYGAVDFGQLGGLGGNGGGTIDFGSLGGMFSNGPAPRKRKRR